MSEATERLRELLAAAGVWPWEVITDETWGDAHDRPIRDAAQDYIGGCPDCGVRAGFHDADAALIAAAVNALPDLLDAADERDRIVAAVEELAATIQGERGVAHNYGCEGEPDCLACILNDLRTILAATDTAVADEGRASIECSCGSPGTYSLNPTEAVLHHADRPCEVVPASQDDFCDLGPCNAPKGHQGTCDEASRWWG